MTMHHPFTHVRRRQNVLVDLASTGLDAANSQVIDDALRAVIEQPHLHLVGGVAMWEPMRQILRSSTNVAVRWWGDGAGSA